MGTCEGHWRLGGGGTGTGQGSLGMRSSLHCCGVEAPGGRRRMEVGMTKGYWGAWGHRPGETCCGQSRWKGTGAGPREGLMRRPQPPRSGWEVAQGRPQGSVVLQWVQDGTSWSFRPGGEVGCLWVAVPMELDINDCGNSRPPRQAHSQPRPQTPLITGWGCGCLGL